MNADGNKLTVLSVRAFERSNKQGGFLSELALERTNGASCVQHTVTRSIASVVRSECRETKNFEHIENLFEVIESTYRITRLLMGQPPSTKVVREVDTDAIIQGWRLVLGLLRHPKPRTGRTFTAMQKCPSRSDLPGYRAHIEGRSTGRGLRRMTSYHN